MNWPEGQAIWENECQPPGDAPETGALTVTKIVTGDQAPDNATYELNVAGPDDYSEDVTLTVNGEGSDSETLANLEPGEYTVTESASPGSPDVTFDPADGNAVVGADDSPTVSVTVTNDYGDDETEVEVESTWPLTVVKSVAGPIPDDDFAFTVDCGDFQLGDQNESFTIDAEGGKKLLGVGIPEDTECTVTETGDANAAETSVTVNDGDTVEAGTVTFDTIDEATIVTFLNTFSPADTEGEPTAPLTVKKVVDGPAPDDDFDFSLDCDGFGVGNDAAFSIDADGGTHTTGISIPEGTECTVVETGDAGAEETVVTVNDGQRETADNATFETTDEVTTVTFLNTFAEDEDVTEVEDQDVTPESKNGAEAETETSPGETEVADDETEVADVTEVKDQDVAPEAETETENGAEVADKTLVAVKEEGATPTRIDAGGGGLTAGQGPGPVGLTAFVALMGGLFLALTRRSPRDQTV